MLVIINKHVFLTSLTNHWQKAGEIHSLAWKPQSMKMAGLVELDFLPICGRETVAACNYNFSTRG